MARPPSNASSVYSRSPGTPKPHSSRATPVPAWDDLPEITPLDHRIFVAGITTMALETTKTHLSTAKSVAQSPLDPITEKRSQRDQQAHENEFFRTCCANFCHLATAVVDITQKLVLEEHFHSDQFAPINARLCRATLALWAALDASRVEEDRAERIWMQELDMPTASVPSSEWI
ncbi:hypothetical protein N7478_010156 [Penicillium angulare]|uniref:uncharacterized protein n=1 Tax=Penicillium angulare TaxID=116970 RepID=UPI002541C031|nr:uncharacterized protein N7478_010156 [Penicillium angulare]KAJ5267348.1 hypothetical protein N7478_010156 [Penicillium angulare]